MRVLIELAGSSKELIDSAKEVIKATKEFVEELSDIEMMYDLLPAILRVDPKKFRDNKPFDPPIITKTQHISLFYARTEAGVFSVQNYAGKKLVTPQEAMEFFVGSVGKRAFGLGWLAKKLVVDFQAKKDGIYLISGLSQESSQELMAALGPEFKTIWISEGEEEVEPGRASDTVLRVKNKSSLKKLVTETINKLKPVRSEK